ncbi:hypothetical protein ASPACDRAFT_47507 [Aspergillus aculeatus ATCC 16872]|uniref:Uncharacterized protein n=1 Tax=Aspergillus aculeatus (strain ATCC 16872 / CBS 172.66 / WB 5094) TaxID=690307 RepID=A0A1L9WHM9_ASPA1|nr:uncharacterized protein ASPACDRAFT_47507 [Aspergillus aculeatus ATCC 16872]OJJ95617.1 hypothetical protein ASPACDRAFT_47507 [Aspergillus aculeatus ATCC 16872]
MIYPLATNIRQYLREHHRPEAKASSTAAAASAYEYAMRETVWQTLAKNADWKKGFKDSMTGRNKTLSIPCHLRYPVQDKLSAADKPLVVVDIGGNQGVDLQRFT